MANIKKIYAYEIIDSRGMPTIEAVLQLDNGKEVSASIPAGSSIGKYEALELRDGDNSRFGGMGVSKATSYINELIAPKLVGISPLKQREVDSWLIKADGTPNKSHLGANTILAISTLFTKAAAIDQGLPLYKYIAQLYKTLFNDAITIEKVPSPIFGVINGGKHANNSLEFQEFQVIPSSSYSFGKALQIGVEIFHELKNVLEYRNANISVGEEGGFTPNFSTNLDALEVITETVTQKNMKIGLDIFLGLDIAASHFYKDERYVVKDKPHPLRRDEYMEFLTQLMANYSILVMEDPLYQDDWDGWKKLFNTISEKIYLVGDDLLSTNKDRLARAIKENTCSAILIKPNQIGTITETLEVVNVARKNNFSYQVSHRSGETTDTFIADFAVGIQADFVKFGAPSRGERVVKYNRMWQIERDEFGII